MYDKIVRKIIKIFIMIFITILIATIVALLILKYNVEGENNMPFELSKIMVISTAEGIDKNNEEYTQNKWDLNIVQNNDIYIEISKNKNYKETEIIDEIIIDNFKIIEEPKVGKLKIYRPSEQDLVTYKNIEENEIRDVLTYIGAEKSSVKKLELANQGGLLLFRYAIEDLGVYTLETEEIKHDGTIISKIDVDYNDLKCKVSFDVSIKLKSEITYTGKIVLDLPAGNILEEGTSHYEKTNLNDIVFKRSYSHN